MLQKGEQPENLSFPGVDEYVLEFDHFAEVVRGAAEPLFPIEDSLNNVQVLQALRLSARRGRPVRL